MSTTPFRARSLRGPLSALLIALLLALIAHGGVAHAAAPGTVPDLTWGAPRTEVDRTVLAMQDAGVKWVRLNLAWNAGEQSAKGSYNAGYFANVDYAVAKARAAGMDVLLPVEGVPYWASADPNKYVDSGGTQHWRVRYRPSKFQDYADFFRYVVNRYKDQGVHAFQVWNEPNLQIFWESGPDADEYVQMLKAAYPAIKAADPSARVLLGGLSPRGAYDYLKGVYAAGGGAYFDSAAYHVYPNGDPTSCWNGSDGRPAYETFCSIDEMRRIMVANGDGAKDMWVTEYGYSTCDNDASACYGVGVTESQQADYLVKMSQKFDSPAYSYVKAAFLYQFRNWAADGTITVGDWEENLGLVRRDFTPKPAYAAWKAYNLTAAVIGGGTTTGGTTGGSTTSGGTTTGSTTSSSSETTAGSTTGGTSASANQPPQVKVTSPMSGAAFSSSLTLSAYASDDTAISKVVFLVDGRSVGSDSSSPYTMTWTAPKKTAYGDHTVTAKAYDPYGLSSSASVTVTRALSATTLSISPSANAAATGRGRRAIVAAGRVKKARGGRVRIVLSRYDAASGRWLQGASTTTRVSSRGAYRAALALPTGRWQAQAVYQGTPRSQSRLVRFSA